jgi:hypothetical protein
MKIVSLPLFFVPKNGQIRVKSPFADKKQGGNYT